MNPPGVLDLNAAVGLRVRYCPSEDKKIFTFVPIARLNANAGRTVKRFFVERACKRKTSFREWFPPQQTTFYSSIERTPDLLVIVVAVVSQAPCTSKQGACIKR